MSDGSVKIDVELTKNKFESALKALESSAKGGAEKIKTVFESAGKRLSDVFKMPTDDLKGLGTALSDTGTKLTKYITKPALAAGTALAGLTLAKGFSRLKSIDMAKAQLEGLGHSAETVTEIMDNAMESVKGTAYGFDEAATAAASAVAAGIEPGKELTRYLGLIGDAAAQSSLSFTDMGSIFNKIMASGKISMEEINQLADQGIPIYKMLAEQLGVTQSEIRDLVSAGEVGSQDFLNAIETNIGGAAKIIGEKSFTGALSNIGASLSRIGANFLDAGGKGGGFFSQLKPLMVDFMDRLEKIEDKASEWGETFGKVFSNVVNIITSIPTSVLGIGTALAVSAGPVLKLSGNILKTTAAIKTFKVEQQGMSILAGIANGHLTTQQAMLLKLGGGLKTAASKLIAFVTNLKLASTATTVFSKAMKLLSANKFIIIAAAIVGIATALGVAAKKAGGFEELFDGIADKIVSIADKAGEFITQFAESTAKNAPQILEAITTALAEGLPALAESGVQILQTLIDSFSNNLPMLIEMGVRIITGLIDSFTANMPMLINAAVTIITGLIMGISQNLPKLVEAAIQLITALIEGISQALPTLIAAAPQIIMSLIAGIIKALPTLIKAAPQIISALVKGILGALGSLVSAGGKILDAVKQGIIKGLSGLASIGRNIIDGLWNGIKGGINRLKSKVSSALEGVKNKIASVFKIGSPSKWMRDFIGKNMMIGWEIGISRNVKRVANAINNAGKEVKGNALSFSPRSLGVATANQGGGSVVDNRVINQNFYNKQTSPYDAYRKVVRGFAY